MKLGLLAAVAAG